PKPDDKPAAKGRKEKLMAVDKKADVKKSEAKPDTKKPDSKKPDTKKADSKKSDNKQTDDKKTTAAGEKAEPAKDEKANKKEEKQAEKAAETVKETAEQAVAQQKKEEKPTTPVDVTTIVREAPSPEVIAEEAEKGYDLMFIGLEKTAARGKLLKKPNDKLNILVPVNGTEASRRGAEVAISIARAVRSPLTVLYVAVGPKRNGRRGIRTRRHEEAILKDIVAIADGYNMSIRTAVLSDTAADEAILTEAKRRKNNLIVMGVGRRPGEKLFFGDTAASLLGAAECSLLFVAS